MPLEPRHDGCAVIVRAEGGQWGSPCTRPPSVRAVWRFERPAGAAGVLLCADHAAELDGHERLTVVARLYDATVEDATV